MRTIDHPFAVPKVRTEIDGFDLIANGGLPRHRVTLVSGTSGSAKTVFAAQFLAAGLLHRRERRIRDVRGVSRRHPEQHEGLRMGH